MNTDLIQPLPEGAGKELVKAKIEELIESVNELYRNPITIKSTENGYPHVRVSPIICHEFRPDSSYPYVVKCSINHDTEGEQV